MVKVIGIAVAVAVLAVVLFALQVPDTFRVERQTQIQATPQRIAALIEDFHQWQQWSPWEKMDPDMKRVFSGPDKGVGAGYAWEGNSKVGSGRMEVVASEPTRIEIKLDFTKPFKAQNRVEFALQAKDGGTNVSWIMQGNNNFISKVMSVFVSMDKMVGQDFESGLSKLRVASEARP